MNFIKNIPAISIIVFVIMLIISFQQTVAQSCVNSVYPSSFNISATGDGVVVSLYTQYGCESYEVYSNESWIYPWVDYIEKEVVILLIQTIQISVPDMSLLTIIITSE